MVQENRGANVVRELLESEEYLFLRRRNVCDKMLPGW